MSEEQTVQQVHSKSTTNRTTRAGTYLQPAADASSPPQAIELGKNRILFYMTRYGFNIDVTLSVYYDAEMLLCANLLTVERLLYKTTDRCVSRVWCFIASPVRKMKVQLVYIHFGGVV